MATASTPSRRSLGDRRAAHTDGCLRVALSHYVTNGASVTVGLVAIMLLIFEAAGLAGASSASVMATVLAQSRWSPPRLSP